MKSVCSGLETLPLTFQFEVFFYNLKSIQKTIYNITVEPPYAFITFIIILIETVSSNLIFIQTNKLDVKISQLKRLNIQKRFSSQTSHSNENIKPS